LLGYFSACAKDVVDGVRAKSMGIRGLGICRLGVPESEGGPLGSAGTDIVKAMGEIEVDVAMVPSKG
jgi:hypothetical protein